MAAVSPAEPD